MASSVPSSGKKTVTSKAKKPTTTKRKPAAKKAKSKTKSKAKAKAKPKKAKAKPKPKNRVKKPLTALQQEAAKKKKERLALIALKEKALTPPAAKPATAYNVYTAEKLTGMSGGNSPDRLKNVVVEYKALSAERMEVCEPLFNTQFSSLRFTRD